MRLERVTFPSADGMATPLEAILYTQEHATPRPAAVVCHPHPMGGGTMHNTVVAAMARALWARGVQALRFNFRGVGASGGDYDYGRGEQADVAGALDWLLAQPNVDANRVAVTGYSFGAWVALSHAQSDPRVSKAAAVCLVAWNPDPAASTGLDLSRFDPSFLDTFSQPKLFVAAENDGFIPPESVKAFVDRLPGRKALHVIPGVDHFLRGHEKETAESVADFVAGA